MEVLQISGIQVEREPNRDRLESLGVFSWSTWTKEASTFPWTYDDSEMCYFLAGKVVVTPDNGDSVEVGKGDLVTFPAGMSCTWEIQIAVEKHYCFM